MFDAGSIGIESVPDSGLVLPDFCDPDRTIVPDRQRFSVPRGPRFPDLAGFDGRSVGRFVFEPAAAVKFVVLVEAGF